MQHLGFGTENLAMLMGFLGIAPGTGNDKKWKDIQDLFGKAQEKICEETLEENIAEEVCLSLEMASNNYKAWERSPEGVAADAETRAKKKKSLLHMEGNKCGITVGIDGTWQKRGSGHSYSSLTGHNYMIGALSRAIVGIQGFSKKCKVCYLARKNNTPPNRHQCSQNFDESKSTKSMEGYGAVRHCIELFRRTSEKAQAWIHTLIIDDDATTRANV
jgi:hypothetical protein